jgi:hypothetical protein
MAFCTTCGANVSGAFCPRCGTPVSVAGSQPTPPPAAMAGVAPAAPPKRKTSPLVWILVIVLGLFLLGGMMIVGTGIFLVHKAHQAGIDPELWHRNPGLAAAKMITAVNPNLEIMRVNDGAGTITLRDKRTGKESTLTFDDARNGRFQIKTEDENGKQATVDFGGSASRLPSWVPVYPGSKPQVTITGSDTSGEGGNFTFTTPDSPSTVMDYFKDKFKLLNMQEGITQTTTNEGGVLTGSGDGKTLVIAVGSSGGQTTVNVTYGQKP